MYVGGAALHFDVLDWVWTILPVAAIFGVGRLCRLPKSTGSVLGTFRPPGVAFAVVWSVLSVLLGFSWAVASHEGPTGAVRSPLRYAGVCTTYGLLVAGLCMWTAAYSGATGGSACWPGATKQVGAYLFLPLFALLGMAFAQGNVLSNVLLAPLGAWLLYAFAMTAGDILMSASR